jgi:hypothetical protein
MKAEIAKELLRIEEDAIYSAQTQFSSAKFWRGLNIALGIPAAVLAAVAGTTVLAEAVSPAVTAATALTAAAMTAALTILNAAQRAEQSRTVANSYLALRAEARVCRAVDLPVLEDVEARNRLGQLLTRRCTVNEAAPVPSLLAYLLGRRNIDKGRHEHEVDLSAVSQ